MEIINYSPSSNRLIMHVSSDEGKIEMDIIDAHNELNNWIERLI
jgi:hypothetical protein